MIRINGIEFELDLSNSKVLDNIKIAIEVCNRFIDDTNSRNLADEDKIIRKETVFFVTLDNIFGEGAADRIFNGVINPEICLDVIKQFNNEINKQISNIKGIVIRFPIERRRLKDEN